MDEFRAAQLVPLPRDEAARQARGDSYYSIEGDCGENYQYLRIQPPVNSHRVICFAVWRA